jgi:cytochrome oxidase Cu insertion factor (SCO1/SenC/PrrC family)
MTAERRRRRTVLVGTFLIFFVPIVAAWLLNVFAPGWRPFGTLNHGILVEPVRQVSTTDLARVDGSAVNADYLSGRWTLVHLLDGDCGQTCIAALARSRQVQQALGDDMQRVQLLLVMKKAAGLEAADLPPRLAIAVANDTWLAEFSFAQPVPGENFGLYLVDPQGYLMMRYPGDVDQRGLLADLERLLKISKIG